MNLHANPLVSVVIACYNDKLYVEEAIQSILNQSYSRIEIIVVDDGSDVETKTVLKSLEPKISELISQENFGQSTARNKGIKEANGDYILILDSDDYFEPTFCEKAIALFLGKKETKIVSCYANLLFEDGSSRLYKPIGGALNEFLYTNRVLGTSMFSKEDWSKCGGYDEEMLSGFEDWEFFIRLLKDGGNAAIIKESLYNYRKRNDSTTSKANKIKYKILNYIYNKHSSLYKKDYEKFVKHLLSLAEKEEEERIKNLNRVEFRLGYKLLRPLRFFKRILS